MAQGEVVDDVWWCVTVRVEVTAGSVIGSILIPKHERVVVGSWMLLPEASVPTSVCFEGPEPAVAAIVSPRDVGADASRAATIVGSRLGALSPGMSSAEAAVAAVTDAQRALLGSVEGDVSALRVSVAAVVVAGDQVHVVDVGGVRVFAHQGDYLVPASAEDTHPSRSVTLGDPDVVVVPHVRSEARDRARYVIISPAFVDQHGVATLEKDLRADARELVCEVLETVSTIDVFGNVSIAVVDVVGDDR